MALRVRVCRVDEVPQGEVRGFRVDGVTWPLAVTRVDGEILVSAGVCPHEDVDLTGGDLDGCILTCPGHGYRFDLPSGRCLHDPELQLMRFPVTVLDGEVWADLV